MWVLCEGQSLRFKKISAPTAYADTARALYSLSPNPLSRFVEQFNLPYQ